MNESFILPSFPPFPSLSGVVKRKFKSKEGGEERSVEDCGGDTMGDITIDVVIHEANGLKVL